jgi:Penicillin-binding protein 5, C-terminal domain
MRARYVAGACALGLVMTSATAASAARVLGDAAEGTVLAAVDPDVTVDTELATTLVLVETVRARLAAGAVTAAAPIPLIGATDPGSTLAGHATLPLGELLQLLLLTRSPTAARSLVDAVGPGLDAARTRMLAAAAGVGLAQTTLPEPLFAGKGTLAPARTTPADLARLGLAIAGDPDLRRRLSLDGVPIAGGDFITRATSPLIAVAPPRAGMRRPVAGPALALAHDGDLDLLAVATGADAARDVWRAIEEASTRYERVLVVREGQPIGPGIDVRSGIIPRFNAIAAEAFAITVERGVAPRLGVRVQLPTAVDAPVEVHQGIGELVIEQRDRIVGVIPLVAPRAIAPSRWLDAAAIRR